MGPICCGRPMKLVEEVSVSAHFEDPDEDEDELDERVEIDKTITNEYWECEACQRREPSESR